MVSKVVSTYMYYNAIASEPCYLTTELALPLKVKATVLLLWYKASRGLIECESLH